MSFLSVSLLLINVSQRKHIANKFAVMAAKNNDRQKEKKRKKKGVGWGGGGAEKIIWNHPHHSLGLIVQVKHYMLWHKN